MQPVSIIIIFSKNGKLNLQNVQDLIFGSVFFRKKIGRKTISDEKTHSF
jgi:hypothetical protein